MSEKKKKKKIEVVETNGYVKVNREGWKEMPGESAPRGE